MNLNPFQGISKLAYPTLGCTPIDSSKEDHLKLINHETWKQLYDSIPEDTDTHTYKLLVLARHGEGYHNAAIKRYGQAKWDSYWSFLNGDEYGEWIDSRLTPLGRKQVEATGSDILVPLVDEMGFLPHRFFSSPLRRCLETFMKSWNCVLQGQELTEEDDRKLVIHVIENLRETLGEHTCDKRVNHSTTTEEYQNCLLPSGHTVHWTYAEEYPEEDQLWLADHRETEKEMDQRIHVGLREMFDKLDDNERFVSLTCHEGVIASTLRNLNHPPVLKLDTGKIVCTVVKVQKSL